MAGPNLDPIYSRIGAISGIPVGPQANTASDGSGTVGTSLALVFVADATNGSFVQRIRFSPVATAAATATSATVLRVFVSSQTSGTLVQSNCWLFAEVAAPSQTADQTATATNFIEVPLNFALPPGYSILASTAVVQATSTSWTAMVLGGSY